MVGLYTNGQLLDTESSTTDGPREGWFIMLETVVVVLMVLWLAGMVTSYTLGGLIHILLVIAVAVVLLRIIRGRNPMTG